MAKPGQRPTPTAKLALKNSWRAKGRSREPKPKPGKPPRPKWLDTTAQKMWTATSRHLAGMGVLTGADANVLARYCAIWSRWRKVLSFLAKHGDTYETICTPHRPGADATRTIKAYPQVAILDRLTSQLTRHEQELGLTPSARTRLVTDGEKTEDELETFLRIRAE